MDLALEAHGGWNHRQRLSKLMASASVGGGLWAVKGKGGSLDNLIAEVECHQQRLIFISPEGRGIYTPTRTAIETNDGKIVESRNNPRAAFEGH